MLHARACAVLRGTPARRAGDPAAFTSAGKSVLALVLGRVLEWSRMLLRLELCRHRGRPESSDLRLLRGVAGQTSSSVSAAGALDTAAIDRTPPSAATRGSSSARLRSPRPPRTKFGRNLPSIGPIRPNVDQSRSRWASVGLFFFNLGQYLGHYLADVVNIWSIWAKLGSILAKSAPINKIHDRGAHLSSHHHTSIAGQWPRSRSCRTAWVCQLATLSAPRLLHMPTLQQTIPAK